MVVLFLTNRFINIEMTCHMVCHIFEKQTNKYCDENLSEQFYPLWYLEPNLAISSTIKKLFFGQSELQSTYDRYWHRIIIIWNVLIWG